MDDLGSGDPFDQLIPRYGRASLADVMPSVMSALGVAGFANPLGMDPAPGVCLLVVDGLGWDLLRAHRESAPYLAALSDAGRPITAGFPSTTSASLASLGTGLPSGQHGMVGYTFLIPGFDRPMNSLQWEPYGHGPKVDLVTSLVPERVQPEDTVMERAAAAGHMMTLVGPSGHARSGLTRAILRGGRYVGADTLDELVEAATAALAGGRGTSVYAYHPYLDTFGHVHGAGSDEWRVHLERVDRAVEAVAGRMPAGYVLAVTADHGMINLEPGDRLDVSEEPLLMRGVRVLAGEARARHVYAMPGAEEDVLAAWREILGERAWVQSGDGAIEAGWFGPRVLDRIRSRIGDVVAAARKPFGVFQVDVDPLHVSLMAHHGSLTRTEQLVPWLTLTANGRG